MYGWVEFWWPANYNSCRHKLIRGWNTAQTQTYIPNYSLGMLTEDKNRTVKQNGSIRTSHNDKY